MTGKESSRFGYSVLAAALGVQAVAIGFSVSAYPIFIESLETDLGATRIQTSFGVPLVIASGLLVGPWVGRAVDQGSPRLVMIAGALAMMLGLLGISVAPSLSWAAAAWVFLVGTGSALLGPIPAMTVIANWFVARRATMVSVAAIGITLGGGIAPAVGELLIQTMGWRTALVFIGLAAAALGVPIAWFWIRKSPEEFGLYPDDAEGPPPPETVVTETGSARLILGDWRFWPLAGTFAALLGLASAFITHVVPLATERGISREVAVALLSAGALSSALGKIVFGVLTDRVGPRRTLFLAVGIQMLAWAGLIVSTNPIPFVASAICFFFALASNVPVQVGFVGALYGTSHFGRATGLLNMFCIVGVFTLSPLIGLGFESSGSYDWPMSLALTWIAIPAVLLVFLRLDPK
jgi:MFS family permease